jgi:hypothetical protein
MQKYYQSSTDLFLYQEDHISMISMALKNLELVEKCNKTQDGAQSLFSLDSQLLMVSTLCEASQEGQR